MAAIQDYRRLLSQLDDLFTQAIDTHRSEMECKRGCSQCCHEDPAIAHVEADAMAEGIASLPSERRAALTQLVTAALPADGTPPPKCVALGVDGACQIYEIRPMVCRTWGLVKFYSKGWGGLRIPMYSRTCWLNFKGRPMRKTEGDGLISFDVDTWDAALHAIDVQNAEERGREATTQLTKTLQVAATLAGILGVERA